VGPKNLGISMGWSRDTCTREWTITWYFVFFLVVHDHESMKLLIQIGKVPLFWTNSFLCLLRLSSIKLTHYIFKFGQIMEAN
jgi:hypothetical protein